MRNQLRLLRLHHDVQIAQVTPQQDQFISATQMKKAKELSSKKTNKNLKLRFKNKMMNPRRWIRRTVITKRGKFNNFITFWQVRRAFLS